MENLAEIHILNEKSIKEAIDEYGHTIPEGLTRKGYLSDLHIFYDYLSSRGMADSSVSDIGQADIQTFADEQKKVVSPSTLRRRLAVLRSFFSWAISAGYTEDNVARRVKLPAKSESYPTYLTKEELHRLLQMPNLKTNMGVRDRCIMSLLYYAGLRVSELCSLTLGSVRPEHFKYKRKLIPAVIVRDGKGGKDRAIPLSSEEAYSDYLAWEAKRIRMKGLGHEALFVNKRGEPITPNGVTYLVKKYSKKAGIEKKISPHTLRHTFATHLAMEGTRLDLIKSYLGHSDLRSTQVYAHITDEEYASGVDTLLSYKSKWV